MRREQILFTAINKNLNMGEIGKDSSTAFKVIHDCMDMVYIAKISEEAKKKKLIKYLQNFCCGKSNMFQGANGSRSRK